MSTGDRLNDQVRVLLASADPASIQPYSSEAARRIVNRAVSASANAGPVNGHARAVPQRRRRRDAAIALGATVVLGGGGMAVAALAPPGTVATPPMAPPVIRTGVGPRKVPLPPAPRGARYLRIVVACFDSTRCLTPGGGSQSSAQSAVWTQDALPLSNAIDPDNPQRIPSVNPASGVPVNVSPDGRWRLWAVYVPSLDPQSAPVGDGRRLGIPGSGSDLPELVPATTTTGSIAWIPWAALTESDPLDGASSVEAVGADATTPAGVVSLR